MYSFGGLVCNLRIIEAKSIVILYSYKPKSCDQSLKKRQNREYGVLDSHPHPHPQKLKNTECVAIEEILSELHGWLWKHLVKIKRFSNEYQAFLKSRLCN